MTASLDKRTIVVLLTILALPIAAVTLFTPFYQTNDDIAMRLLAEGNFVPGDEPLPYLMFINVIIGKILASAYQLTAAVPWYDVVLGATMIAASAALLHIWIGSASKAAICWAVVFAAHFLFPTFVSVQFSLAGMACSAAGLALIAYAAATADERRQRFLALGAVLFFWGSLIRAEGAILIAVEAAILALPFAVSLFRERNERSRLRGLLSAIVFALLLTGIGIAINQLAYRHAAGWKNFYEYNILRGRLAEYIAPERITPETKEQLTRNIGWSANDFALFSNWFFTDPQLFSLAKVRQAERLFFRGSMKPTEDVRRMRVARGIALGKDFFKETRWTFLLLAAFVVAHGMRPKLVLYFVGLALTLGILIVGISLAFKAPPQRIFWPMLIMAATMLAIAAQRWGQATSWRTNLATLVPALYLVVMPLLSLKHESDTRKAASEMVREDVAGLRGTGATMFVLHAQAFPYEDFWTPLHNEKATFDFVGLGASARTPPVQDFLAKSNLSDLPWALCNAPTMLIVAAPYVPPMLSVFVQEHHGTAVQFDEAFHGRRFVAWKCRRSP